MKKPRIYGDTSVIGGCSDPEFQVWSTGLMEDFRTGRFRRVLSDLTAADIQHAPEPIRELHGKWLSIAPLSPVPEEVLAILAAYESHGVLGPRFRIDMLSYGIGYRVRDRSPGQLELPTYRPRVSREIPANGDMKGLFSVGVRANWRIVFRFEEGNAFDVDFIDYH